MARNGKKENPKAKESAIYSARCCWHRYWSHRDLCGCARGTRHSPGEEVRHLYRGLAPLGGLAHWRVQSKRWPWNRQEFTGSPFSKSWRAGVWKFAWSTPAISKGCRVAKPTFRIASGCNTSTLWDCCEDLSGLRRPFVRFAASCAIATTSLKAPRAKCCSCKKPSPR